MSPSFTNRPFDDLLILESIPATFSLCSQSLFGTMGVVDLDLANSLHVGLLHLCTQVVLKGLLEHVLLFIRVRFRFLAFATLA